MKLMFGLEQILCYEEVDNPRVIKRFLSLNCSIENYYKVFVESGENTKLFEEIKQITHESLEHSGYFYKKDNIEYITYGNDWINENNIDFLMELVETKFKELNLI